MSGSDRLRELAPLLTLTACASAIVAAIALLWLASETHYRACIERAETQYPTVPVSAFVTKDKAAVGPLKVSYARERRRALEGCGRI